MCWLHIGTHKTGTTALQSWLYAHREALAEQGVLYPLCCVRDAAAGLCDHNPLHYAHRRFTQQLRAELHDSGARTLILSAEDLFFEGGEQERAYARFRSAPGCAALRAWLQELGVQQCRVLVYLRQSVALAAALYVQSVQDGLAHAPQFTPLAQALCATRTWLRHWIETWGRECICARLYERQAWPQGGLLHDFAAATGLQIGPDAALPPANVSLSLLELELLRPLNALSAAPLWQPQTPRGRLGVLLRSTLAAAGAADERFALPADIAREVERRSAAHEAWAGREFFGVRGTPFRDRPAGGTASLEQLTAQHWQGVSGLLRALAQVLPGGMAQVRSGLQRSVPAAAGGYLQALCAAAPGQLPPAAPPMSGAELGQALAPVLRTLEGQLP